MVSQQPLKTLHVITSLEWGGAETFLSRLLEVGDERFLPEVVCLTDGAPEIIDRIRKAGVKVTVLRITNFANALVGFLRLIRIVRRTSPGAVVSWLYHSDIMALALKLFCRVPLLIWNIRCSNLDMHHYSKPTAILRWLLSRLSVWPDAVICNSRAGLHYHFDIGYRARRWLQLSNGFDTDKFCPSPVAHKMLRAALGVSATTPLIGLIARIDPMKGHDVFFTAVIEVRKQFPDAKFVLVGRGADSANADLATTLQHMGLSDSVYLLGYRSDVEAIYPALDVLVSSSTFGEGMSNVIGEAMASGTPCVVTDIGDSARLISGIGRVVEPGNPSALAEGINALLGEIKHNGKVLSGQVRAHIVDNHDLKDAAKRFGDKIVEEYEEKARSRDPVAKRKVRLIVACNEMAPGGTELQIAQLLGKVSRARYRPTLFLLRKSKFLTHQLLDQGVTIQMPRHASRSAAINNLAAFIRLVWAQSRSRFDIAHFFLPETYLVAGAASLVLGPNRRVMSRRSLNYYQRDHPLAARVEWFLHRFMAAFTGNGEVVSDQIRAELPPSRTGLVARIHNGVQLLDLSDQRAERQRFRQAYGLGKDCFLIVMVANFYLYKGHLDLINALSGIKNALPENWALACIGRDAGSMDKALRLTDQLDLKNHVHFLGQQGPSEVCAALLAADLSVLCSHHEGFPNTLLESMAAGLPTVSTDVGGIPEIVSSPEIGIVVPPHDPPALGQAILSLANDPAYRMKMGAVARQTVSDRFPVESMVRQHEDLYAALLQNRLSNAQEAIDG